MMDNDDVNILLLEGISQNAQEIFTKAGYHNLKILKSALDKTELEKELASVELLGIRSRTQITAEVLNSAKKLRAIGCFCIGTNQVDLKATQLQGIPVFNAPFPNTRSVAELTIGSIIHLFRGISEKNIAAHRGEWQKTVKGSYEIRGKKLGIVGYGNIGSQLSILASNLGMHVYYYDEETKLAHGNAQPVESLMKLLSLSDVVSLHIPGTAKTKNLINEKMIQTMKPGSFLINYARGDVVDIPALEDALASKHISGAAIDVFPVEPKTNQEPFISPLQQFDQVILSPHIGGSTQEAQKNISVDVSQKLINYWEHGSSNGAVNFPSIGSPIPEDHTRILNIHRNKPGMLQQINDIISLAKLNVSGQSLQTFEQVGYVSIDIEGKIPNEVIEKIEQLSGSINTRVIFW